MFIVLVVVVVVAMASKGEQAGEIRYVFRRSESNPTGVVSTVSIGNDVDVEPSTEYILEAHRDNGRNGREKIATTEIRTSETGKQLTIPKATIEETEQIKPGVPVVLKLFEVEEEEAEEPQVEISDNASVLGRNTVSADPSCSDGCDARLHSEPAKEYLDSLGGTGELKFRNLRTNEEVVGESHSNYQKTGNAVQFKKRLREQINAQHGDLIEIIKPGRKEDKSVEELIREMHGMMMEMYNDYLEQHD